MEVGTSYGLQAREERYFQGGYGSDENTKNDDIPNNLMDSYSWLYGLIKIMAATAGIRIHPHEPFKRALRGEDLLLALSLLDGLYWNACGTVAQSSKCQGICRASYP
jgi:hypothetical protein